VAPPGNQAANGENKSQPVVSGETGLLESTNLYFHRQKATSYQGFFSHPDKEE
jgi:hypothetical protein